MNELKSTDLLNQIYIIGDKEYIRANYIVEKLGLTHKRIKLWKDGRGQAKNNPLNYIKINENLFLYSKEDIEKLILLTNHWKNDKSIKPFINDKPEQIQK